MSPADPAIPLSDELILADRNEQPWRALYPFRCREISVRGGHHLRFIDEGPTAGPPVLMVHGNPTWSFYYRNLVLALRDRYRCVALDHIGCGLSDKPRDDRYEYTLGRRVEDLSALAAHLELDRDVTLIVHDWGGMIGCAWALERPERIGRIVVLNTAAFGLPAGKRLPWQLALLRRGPLGPLLIRGFNAFVRGALTTAVTRPLPDDVRAGLAAPYDSWRNRIAVLRFVQDIPIRSGDRSYDLVSEVDGSLGRLAGIPMLIAWGERDFVFDRAFQDEWRRRFPKAEVHSFPDAGHYVLEDAADRIIPLVSDFLSRTATRHG